jgi:nudix motif 8
LELDGVASIVSAAATTTANSRVFHLFTPSVEKSVWKTVPLNEERQAAVLVTLVCYKNKPALIYTTRSNDLPTHQGEVSFPGGHFDSTQDKTLEETAVREAKEELMGPVSFPWDDITIIGRATPLPSILGTPVTPIIAVLPYEVQSTPDGSGSDSVLHPTIFPGSPDEVANVFCVTIEDLLEIEATEPSDRFKMNIPVFPTHDNKKIWGLTAVVTRPLLHNLFKRVLL